MGKLNRTHCRDCGKKLDGCSPVYCKKCNVTRIKEWLKNTGKTLRQLYGDSIRKSDKEYQRLRREENPGMKTEEYRKWRKKYPKRVEAQQLLNIAIKKGKIKKQPCEVCKRKDCVHAHHDDYSKPYEVRWLCPIHHQRHHIELKLKGH